MKSSNMISRSDYYGNVFAIILSEHYGEFLVIKPDHMLSVIIHEVVDMKCHSDYTGNLTCIHNASHLSRAVT